MKTFHLKIGTAVFRLYLMMLIVIVAGFSGVWAIAFLALPVFLFTLLGVEFRVPGMHHTIDALKHSMLSMIEHLHIPVHHTT